MCSCEQDMVPALLELESSRGNNDKSKKKKKRLLLIVVVGALKRMTPE